MHTVGKYLGTQRTLEGDLILTIAIQNNTSDMEKLEHLKECEISVDIKKYSPRRSLNANAYFWKLCDLIAKKLGSDKDTIYLMMLKEAGVFEMYDLPEEAVDQISRFYRYVEIDHYYEEYIENDAYPEGTTITKVQIKAYRGSHEYNSKEMADLINYTVIEAQGLGIDTLLEDEIADLVERWDGR